MDDTQVDIQEVLAILRESIGKQAQEIAVLKSVISTLNTKINDEKIQQED